LLRSPIWSIVGRGEQYRSYTVQRFFGRGGYELTVKKILNVLGPKSKQRPELDHRDAGRTPGGVVPYPAFGNSQAFGDILGGQKTLT